MLSPDLHRRTNRHEHTTADPVKASSDAYKPRADSVSGNCAGVLGPEFGKSIGQRNGNKLKKETPVRGDELRNNSGEKQ